MTTSIKRPSGPSLFELFEASLAPAERGNLVDMVDDLQFGADFSDAWERYTELVWPKMERVLDALEITEGNHGPPIEHGCLHSCHIAITCVPPPSFSHSSTSCRVRGGGHGCGG